MSPFYYISILQPTMPSCPGIVFIAILVMSIFDAGHCSTEDREARSLPSAAKGINCIHLRTPSWKFIAVCLIADIWKLSGTFFTVKSFRYCVFSKTADKFCPQIWIFSSTLKLLPDIFKISSKGILSLRVVRLLPWKKSVPFSEMASTLILSLTVYHSVVALVVFFYQMV